MRCALAPALLVIIAISAFCTRDLVPGEGALPLDALERRVQSWVSNTAAAAKTAR